MIVVSNTTPLIGLATIQRFDVLHHLFGEIHIAQAAYNDTHAGVLYYLDEPGVYRNSEACVYDAASFLFAMLALDR